VEDSLPIRTQLRRILERSGYEVTTAVDGADGFQQLRTGTFDAIVSDVEMPQQSGIEMTQRIRQLPEYQRLPIVLVTTLAAASDRQRALAAGANAYLTKGNFDQTLLLDTLRELIHEQN
jgi:two-component system chemotaxis sensor kinase CheA